MSKNISKIFFDVDGVLIKANINDTYRMLSKKIGLDHKKFKRIRNKNLSKLLRGKIRIKEIFDKVSKKRISSQKIMKYWKNHCTDKVEVNEKLIDEVKKLKGEYETGIISDADEMRSEIDSQLNLYKNFDHVFLSYIYGKTKKNRNFFDIVAEKTNTIPQESIFIDDFKHNLESARKIGFNTIHYQNNLQLFKELKAQGIDKINL